MPGVIRTTAQLQAIVPAVGRAGLTPSPVQYTLTGNESLRLVIRSRAQQTTVALTSRQYRDSDDAVAIFGESFVVPTFSSGTTKDIPLTAGALLNLRASTPDSGVVYGSLWVQVFLIHGQGGAVTVLGTLLQGYLSAANDLAWPGSPIQAMHDGRGLITDGNWEFKIAPSREEALVPAGVRWRVIAGTFTLNTSAVPGTRTMVMRAVSALGFDYWRAAPTQDVGASGTILYSVGAGVQPTNQLANAIAYLPWPTDLELAAGDAIIAEIGGAQAGDFIAQGGLLVREWMDL